jgi:hypothetical protein
MFGKLNLWHKNEDRTDAILTSLSTATVNYWTADVETSSFSSLQLKNESIRSAETIHMIAAESSNTDGRVF